jgi:hypothetical protein
MTFRGFLPLLALLLLGCGLLAACGDDDEEPIDPLPTYLTQLSAVASLSNVQIEGLAEQYPAAFEEVPATQEYYRQYVDSYARFLNAAKQIPAPGEISAQHDEYVAASEAVLQGSQARLAELESAATIDEVNAIFDDDPVYTAAVERQDAACQALKDIADEQAVNVPGLGDCNNFN